DVGNRILMTHKTRIQRKGQKTAELMSFRHLANRVSIAICFLWPTITAIPALAVEPYIPLSLAIRRNSYQRKASAALATTRCCIKKNAFICVAIILYFVKRRNPLRRFAPQNHVARYARDAESSALRLSTTFMLKDIQTTRSERRN